MCSRRGLARSRRYRKRGGSVGHVPFDERAIIDVRRGRDLVALDDARDALAQVDARKGQS